MWKRINLILHNDSDTGNGENQIIGSNSIILYKAEWIHLVLHLCYAGDTVSGSIYFEDNSKKKVGQVYRK